MFQSCSGPDNQWVISQGDDRQDLYDSGPLPHSWPQFCPTRPSGTIHHSRSQRPYGGAYTGAQTPVWCQRQNTWMVGSHNTSTGQRVYLRHICVCVLFTYHFIMIITIQDSKKHCIMIQFHSYIDQYVSLSCYSLYISWSPNSCYVSPGPLFFRCITLPLFLAISLHFITFIWCPDKRTVIAMQTTAAYT